jgi:hypothetical protein
MTSRQKGAGIFLLTGAVCIIFAVGIVAGWAWALLGFGVCVFVMGMVAL